MKLGVSFYYVGDIKKATELYSRFLNAAPVYADEDWVRFHLDGGDLALHLDSKIPETRTPARVQYGAVVSFTVQDIERTITKAKEMDFTQAGNIQVLPYGKQAEIRDPWGNRIALLEPAQGG